MEGMGPWEVLLFFFVACFGVLVFFAISYWLVSKMN